MPCTRMGARPSKSRCSAISDAGAGSGEARVLDHTTWPRSCLAHTAWLSLPGPAWLTLPGRGPACHILKRTALSRPHAHMPTLSKHTPAYMDGPLGCAHAHAVHVLCLPTPRRRRPTSKGRARRHASTRRSAGSCRTAATWPSNARPSRRTSYRYRPLHHERIRASCRFRPLHHERIRASCRFRPLHHEHIRASCRFRPPHRNRLRALSWARAAGAPLGWTRAAGRPWGRPCWGSDKEFRYAAVAGLLARGGRTSGALFPMWVAASRSAR